MRADDAPDRTTVEENRRRIRAWTRAGDLDRLWPEVPAAARRGAQRVLRRVVEALLAGEKPPALDAWNATGAHALGIAGFTSGLGPLLGHWIEQGAVDAVDPVRQIFGRHLEQGRLRARRLAEALAQARTGLRQQGIEPVVLKGMHTAAVYFPEPATRPAADVDLLVGDAGRPEVVAGMESAGFVEVQRTRLPARSVWQPRDASGDVVSLELDHVDNPWSVDVHASLDRLYFRGLTRGLGVDPPRVEADLGDAVGMASVLSQPTLTVLLAQHASEELTRVRLIRLVELALVLRRDAASGSLDWHEADALLEQHDLRRFVHPALALTELLAPGTVPGPVLDRGRRTSTPRTHRVLDAVQRADLGPLPSRTLDNKLMWARGGNELALNLSELVWPSDDGSGLGRGRVFLRGLRTVLKRGR